MKEITKELIFWVIVIAVIAAGIWLVGCQPQPEQITKEQWLERYKPETIEQAEAMAVLNNAKIEAESKAKTLAIMNKFKIACAVGLVGSIVAFGIGLWLRMKLVVGLGIVGVMGCLAGYCLVSADIVYGKIVATVGLIFGVIIGGMTIFILVRALYEIVKGGERLKEFFPVTKIPFKKSYTGKADGGVQSKPTQKIVREIKSKL